MNSSRSETGIRNYLFGKQAENIAALNNLPVFPQADSESAHSLISRPGSFERPRSNLRLPRGDSAKNCTRLRGCRARLVSRSNCSAGKTTTWSFPWRVTTCGPSLRARRNNSLKRALAACNCHAPDGDLSTGPASLLDLLMVVTSAAG